MILVLQLLGEEKRLPNAILTGAPVVKVVKVAKVVVKVAEAPVAEGTHLDHGTIAQNQRAITHLDHGTIAQGQVGITIEVRLHCALVQPLNPRRARERQWKRELAVKPSNPA